MGIVCLLGCTVFLLLFRRDGGSYQEYTGSVRGVDAVERAVVFLAENCRSRGKTIAVGDIVALRWDAAEAFTGSEAGD